MSSCGALPISSPDLRESQSVRPRLDGILVVDKPAGWTSHDVVGWIRKWSGERKVGHAGTLDPAATGVLPVALNDGTRVLEFLSEADKVYEAEITFGIETDSADADGTVTSIDNRPISIPAAISALDRFRGEIQQVPPSYSAIKINGQRAYDLARAGHTVEMPTRTVTISSLEVINATSDSLTISIECSKGTYIRSLARDLGIVSGSVAHLSNLIRTRSGPFQLANAWTIDELREIDPWAEWPEVAEHPDTALPGWPSIVLNDEQRTDWLYGRAVPAHAVPQNVRCRVYDYRGNWLGLAEHDASTETWRAVRVIGRP